MGKLLSLLARDDSNCCSPQKYDVFLDFENAQPTEGERGVFEEVQHVMLSAENILEELAVYKGAGREIREAISTPNEEFQKRAWLTVVPLVTKLKRFYDFSLELEEIVPKILGELCSGAMTPTQHLETQQAIVKQFAEILEFVLKFDEYKMKTPAIQNDFSYYRRTVNRMRICRDHNEENTMPRVPDVSIEVANRMSLFYAHATPMLRVLSEATSRFVQELFQHGPVIVGNEVSTPSESREIQFGSCNSERVATSLLTMTGPCRTAVQLYIIKSVFKNSEIPIENTTETLSTMAKVCLRMLESPSLIAQFQREETQLFVLRVMVGLVILYDHVHPHGAFVKASNVDVKGCVKLLKDQPAVRSEGLLNALRYTTKHLNEDATPKHIKNLLAA